MEKQRKLILQVQCKKYLNLHIHCLLGQSLHLTDPYKASFPSIRAVWTQHVNFSALILALTFSCPVLVHSVLGEETRTGAHPFISEPVKPEWRVNAADANSKTHISHMMLKGNDATLFALFKPFIFCSIFSFGNIASKAKQKKNKKKTEMCVFQSYLVASYNILMWILWTTK